MIVRVSSFLLFIQYFCKRPISNGTDFDGFYLFIFAVPVGGGGGAAQVYWKKWNYGEILQLGDYFYFFSESEKNHEFLGDFQGVFLAIFWN